MQMLMIRYGKRAAFAAFIILALLLGKQAVVPASAPHTAGPKAVKTVILSPTPFQPTATFAGFVRGVRQTSVAAKTAGYAVQLLREEGDAVRRGDTLAIFDDSERTAARKAAIDTLAATNRTYRDTEAYYDQKVSEAKSAYDNTERHGTADEADAANEAWRSAKRLRDTQVSAARAERTAATGTLDIAQASAENAIVRAPFDGIITRRILSLGSYVTPGMPIYDLVSVDTLEIPVSIPASVARNITKGTAVTIGPDSAKGQVFSIATAVGEATQTAIARVRFTAGTDRFVPGDLASIAFPTGPDRTALLVPAASIIRVYDDAFVRTVLDGTVATRPVTVGSGSGTFREVLTGLTPGEHVITEGQTYVRSGDPITEHQ